MMTETPTPNGHVDTPTAERISAEDHAYYLRCLGNLREAQATFNHWGSFMCERYKVGPTDRINEDGSIERAVIEDETP
jgi:hypothetical protein